MSPTLPELLLCQVFCFCVNQLYLSCFVSTNFTWAALCQVFRFCFSSFLPELLLSQVFRFCVAVPQMLRNWESLFTLSRFLLYTPSPNLVQAPLPFSRYNWMLHQPSFFKVAGPPKHRPGPSVCLDHTVFSERYYPVRFYLRVKALQSTISTSSRFWTHSLIATYILKSMPYPLGGSSS